MAVTATRPRAPSTPSDEPVLSLRAWVRVVGVLLLCAGGLETLLQTNLVWRLPLGYLLQDGGDRYTRAMWLVHRPPPSGAPQLLVLGASTAAAITELPGSEAAATLQTALRLPQLHVTSLTVSRGCYGEHLTILQGAIQNGHRPDVVLLFSWPGCLADDDETDALLATRMPLSSHWLADVTASWTPAWVPQRAAALRTLALPRYRHTINAWLRSRWERTLRGNMPWAQVVFAGDRRTRVWEGPWENDRDRYERLLRLPQQLRPSGRGMRVLERVLTEVRNHGGRAVIVEAPWAPPFFDVLHGVQAQYEETMQAVAARTSAVYVNPNRDTRLSRDLFNDLYHVNHAGARAYLPHLAAALAPVLPPH